MRLKKITLREIHLPLVEPFQTSFDTTKLRRILLLEADVDGATGWGESTAGEDPYYCYETVETAWLILRDYLWPLLKGREFATAGEVFDLFARVRGHNMAKAGLEIALWDAEAKLKKRRSQIFSAARARKFPAAFPSAYSPASSSSSPELRGNSRLVISASKLKSNPAGISSRSECCVNDFPASG